MWFSKAKFNQNGFDVDVSICAEDSNPPPGDIEFDSEEEKDKFIKEIYRRLEQEGDLWAWCFVKVEVSYMGFTGSTTLGECSYLSYEKFKEDGYFNDMLNDARNDCMQNIRLTIERSVEAKLAQESFPESI